MTVYYEEEENVVIANNAEEFAEFTDDGALVIDCDEMPRGVGKIEEFERQFGRALEANQEE